MDSKVQIFQRIRPLAWTILCALTVSGQGVKLVPESTKPLVQLTGEHFQIFSNGVYYSTPTQSRTASRYGVLGSDLGYPVRYSDKTIVLFGDTMSVRPAGKGRDEGFVLLRDEKGQDSIGFMPNTDLSKCQHIPEIDRQIREGNKSPQASFDGCPELRFYRTPERDPKDHAFQTTRISGLEGGDNLGPFGTPSGAFDLNGRMYMFYIVKNQEAKPHFALKSILAKSKEPVDQWREDRPPSFERVYTVSEHDKVDDPSNPPPEEGNRGKFMFNPLVVMSAEDLKANGFQAGLPAQLREAPKVILVFGSSWRYNRSNLYLAAFSSADVEGGTSKWFYYSGGGPGAPQWTNDEAKAAPLFPGDPRIGNHSVAWNPALRQWVVMYGNVIARFGAAPWGPWGQPVPMMRPKDDWAMKIVHHPGTDPIKRSVVPVMGPRMKAPLDLGTDTPGVPYGPFVMDQSTQNSDGSVTLYYLMSTWNPYQVFLMSSAFKK